MNENLEEIGQVADTLDALVAAMQGIPIFPAKIHLEIIKEAIPEVSLRLKKAYIAKVGEDPWNLE